jgi:DNA-binding NarL/FixJ family response regulator
MEKLNLFILANNALVVNGLRHYLIERFGDGLNISNYYDTRTCLRNLKTDTQVIVTDVFLNGKNAADSLKIVREKNPGAHIVLHSSKEAVAAWIDQYYGENSSSLN